MIIEAVSVIPEVFEPYMSASIMGRARAQGIFEFSAYDLRDWTHDRHRTVDDAPFGGGPGMLMKPEPIYECVEALKAARPEPAHVIFFTPTGTPFSQQTAERLCTYERLLFVCGRYEGTDERCFALADEQISLGDYVITGGELAALTVTDALVRLLPGALGGAGSAEDESFTDGLLEYAQYTRPANFAGQEVPSVLLSGDHAKVALWRRQDALRRTFERRPDLLASAPLTEEDRAYLRSLGARF